MTARRKLQPNMLLLGIASAAFAGSAIEAGAEGDADPWATLQLFWGF